MRILVCGGRDYEDYDTLKTVLSSLQVTKGHFTAIIHGDAKGADKLAGRYAEMHNIPVARFPADWERHGKKAGPLRNKQMLAVGKPDLVVAFAGGKGTADMIHQSKKAGVEIFDAREGGVHGV